MAKDQRNQYITRNNILNMLSPDETARVSNAETAAQLAVGDEFIDLTHIEKGVQRAAEAQPTENVLPRKGLHESTWNKIVRSLHVISA
ncbi:MAG: hypothetical protein RL701_2715 [Pseudomonadota bacterium]|jgi:hypothetical protein